MPPVGRDYGYNLELFGALRGLNLKRFAFFTSYVAADARSIYTVLRCELCDWAAAQDFHVTAVATILDVIYSRWDWSTRTLIEHPIPGRTCGSYFADVIIHVERALLAREAADGCDKLQATDEIYIEVIDQVMTFSEIVEMEMQLMKAHRDKYNATANKRTLAEFWLSQGSHTETRLLFLDDSQEYISQVQEATAHRVAGLRCVLVAPSIECAELMASISAPE